MTVAARSRWWPAACYGLVASALTLVLWQSAVHLAPGEAGLAPRVHLEVGDGVVGPWLFWDGGVYHSLSEHGYTDDDVAVFASGGEARVAFFPGYPFLARGVATVVGDRAVSLIVVTLASGCAAALLLHRWARARTSSLRAADLTVLAVLLYPWAFFLAGAAYSEALFLACALGAFLLIERDRPVLAGLVGAAAAATRAVGIGVALALLVHVLVDRGVVRFEGWRPRLGRGSPQRGDLGVLLAPVGLLGFAGFCWARYGDPLAFATAQRGWGSPPGLRTWIKAPFVDVVLDHPNLWFVMRLTLHGLVGLAFCAAIPAVWRRFGPAYGIYSLVVIGMPMLAAGAFASMGRHMLVAFPVFGLVGERLSVERPRRAAALLVVSAAVLVAWTSFWGRGYWMA